MASKTQDASVTENLSKNVDPDVEQMGKPFLKPTNNDDGDDSEVNLDPAHEVQEGIETEEVGGPLCSFTKCKKHPDHHQFIPVGYFGETHIPTLPDNFQLTKEEIVRWVLACSDMVVRVRGNYISSGRPDLWKNKLRYPFSKRRGRHVSNTGSGWMWGMSGPHDGRCECESCENADDETCKTRYWSIGVNTARHVVFDDQECRKSEVVFFDNNPDGSDTLTFKPRKSYEEDTDKDHIELNCFTHDGSVADKLEAYFNKRKEVYCDILDKLEQSRMYAKELIFVVSHPHGKMKYITVGKYSHDEEEEGITYTAATCPGSSGGLVLSVGAEPEAPWNVRLLSRPHWGAMDKHTGRSADWKFIW